MIDYDERARRLALRLALHGHSVAPELIAYELRAVALEAGRLVAGGDCAHCATCHGGGYINDEQPEDCERCGGDGVVDVEELLGVEGGR